MPSTYLSLHFHIIFGTKNRTPWITDAWRHRLHEYLGGTLRGLGAVPEGIGGIVDHVHILAGLKATHSLADVVREAKKASSVWIHHEIGRKDFSWQEGYAAFTISPTGLTRVQRYVSNQVEHHREKTFREELIDMLNLAGIEFDLKYLD